MWIRCSSSPMEHQSIWSNRISGKLCAGTLAWIYALNWKKLRCRHTRSFVSWMQLFGDLQFEHSNRLPGIKSIWISICFLALLNSIDLMYHGSWRFNASLNRSSWDRVTHYNSGNDIIKPYPIPTQNSEEPILLLRVWTNPRLSGNFESKMSY